MNKQGVRARIEDVGIVPVIRAASEEEARFAAEAVLRGGIPVIEITMTVPGAVDLICELTRTMPDLLVGAGTVLDARSAQQCLDAGAKFLVAPGLELPTVAFAAKEGVLMMAGALSPTEVLTAWRAGSDLVKVFPCSQVGGASYIRALKGPLPQIPLVPTGGVNLENAAEFIRAGSAALGVGGELVLKEAVKARRSEAITETARQLVEIVRRTRAEMTAASARAR
jgi:2-dehydro-3-deoxyphosphogluconate aldolase / (4S)-4-hydroxy-2-oxoglutarate aldolase